jgi:hypothetical protein
MKETNPHRTARRGARSKTLPVPYFHPHPHQLLPKGMAALFVMWDIQQIITTSSPSSSSLVTTHGTPKVFASYTRSPACEDTALQERETPGFSLLDIHIARFLPPEVCVKVEKRELWSSRWENFVSTMKASAKGFASYFVSFVVGRELW